MAAHSDSVRPEHASAGVPEQLDAQKQPEMALHDVNDCAAAQKSPALVAVPLHSPRSVQPELELQSAPESVLQGSGVPEHVPVTPGGAPGLLPPRSFSFSPGQLLQAASASAVSAAPNFDALCFGRMQEMKRWTDRSARGCDRPAEGGSGLYDPPLIAMISSSISPAGRSTVTMSPTFFFRTALPTGALHECL